MRIAGSNKSRIEKEYPKSSRFSKEQLGKYYIAWGDQPYVVKKGGDKVFRYFIEEISGNDKEKKPLEIDRNFYENLISKIILFNDLEKIYGQGSKAMGNLRSAVIPYSISAFYRFTSKRKDGRIFDLRKIWIKEKLEKDLAEYFKDLMLIMNQLVKSESESEDYGEYSKRKELWDNISITEELQTFFENENSLKILNKYTITSEESLKRNLKTTKNIQVDFKLLSDNINVSANGSNYYSNIENYYREKLTKGDCIKLDLIISSIIRKEDIDQKHIDFEKDLIHKIRISDPEIFDKLNITPDTLLLQTLDFIINEYNKSIENQNDVTISFNKIQNKVKETGKLNSSVYGQIGKILLAGKSPNVKQIHEASCYLKDHESKPLTDIIDQEDIKIDIDLTQIKKMVEWDSKYKILTNNERTYLADLAFGFKELTSFHERNVKKHLNTLIKAGYHDS